MRTARVAPLMIVAALWACGQGSEPQGPEALEGESPSQPATGTAAPAGGSIPAGLPARLMIGLFEDTGETWMKDSGVPWDVRYRYFTKGWVNNFGWGSPDGSFARDFMNESAAQGFIPAITYYVMQDEAGGGESAFWAKTRDPATMRSYFGDFKILMERAKEFGKPVLVLVEPDGTGLLQQQTNGDPAAPAAIAASGLPELAGLPDTVAGWGLAFLKLREAAGANNVVLGLHVSAWASGKDLAHGSVTDPLEPEVTKVRAFLEPFGLSPNPTGGTYDVLVGDPLDRDADFYRLTRNEDRWWDPADDAPVSSQSFNRYAEWMRLWNEATGRRWVLWQIPLGNSNHLNVSNTGQPRGGYKDNRPEYFFGSGSPAHLQKFASSGAIALLFGAGATGQSTHRNDVYTDGQLFMKSRAGPFLEAGGLSLPAKLGP